MPGPLREQGAGLERTTKTHTDIGTRKETIVSLYLDKHLTHYVCFA